MKEFTILVIYKAKNEGDREDFVKELTDTGVLDAIRNETAVRRTITTIQVTTANAWSFTKSGKAPSIRRCI